MLNYILSLITIAFYSSIAILLAFNLKGKFHSPKVMLAIGSGITVIFHAIILHQSIDTPLGQNLSLVNMLSMVLWVMNVLLVLGMLRRSVENLLLLTFPLAACSILLILLFPTQRIVDTATDSKALIHILLAVLTFSVLCIAALQALLLAWQERSLRQGSCHLLLQKMPPVETMEVLLFQTIWCGFILLTIIIASSLYFFHEDLLLPKLMLALIAWIIFGGLLIGRHGFGWRGHKAIYGTLIGVLLLVILYVGSIVLSG